MQFLNFDLPDYGMALLKQDAFCAIRLGDKRNLYREGGVIGITHGLESKRKQYLYSAFVDQVTVKPIPNVNSRELSSEPLGLKSQGELVKLLEKVYNKSVQTTDQVSVIYFSRIIE